MPYPLCSGSLVHFTCENQLSCAKPKRKFENQTILEIKLFSPNCVTLQAMEYANFGGFFLLLLQFTSPVRVRGGKLVGRRVQNPTVLHVRHLISTWKRVQNHARAEGTQICINAI